MTFVGPVIAVSYQGVKGLEARSVGATTGTSAPRGRPVGEAQVPGAGASGGAASPVRIAGRAPSLSTEMIGLFGRLDQSGRFSGTDPVTGQPGVTGTATSSGFAEAAEAIRGTGSNDLTPEEQAEVQKLRAIDQRVRQHEAAHKAAGAGVTGPATFTMVTGPDGRQYAVGGEVSITVNASQSNPQQAIAQLEQVKRAALAPADPSSADRAAAAAAEAALQRAKAALRDQEEQEAAEQKARNQQVEGAAQQTDGASRDSGGEIGRVIAPAAFADAAAAYGTADRGFGGAQDDIAPPASLFDLVA
ncbi:SprA-related family protein [Rhodospira trueperi]|uniref:SprA-related family protein n=1 Tax=Rhodospira trueperi TaxID=69960 RepID=A0A1G6WPK0_9PROT|nr:SprA-related family protein [Rhodospira trueperi]